MRDNLERGTEEKMQFLTNKAWESLRDVNFRTHAERNCLDAVFIVHDCLLSTTTTTMTTPDVPSSSQLDEAKERLKLQQGESWVISRRISEAQATLAQIIADSKLAIRELEDEKQRMENDIEHTKAFLSPMRRLPDDILQLLFWFEFEAAPCCAWALSAVCSRWRRIILNMPRMWSKVSSIMLSYTHSKRLYLMDIADAFGNDAVLIARHNTTLARALGINRSPRH